jgi:shikimate kinase
VLVGLPGAGKSTVGPLLGQRLGWEFIDIDQAIVATTGRSVAELFNSPGEAAFRELEARLTAELSSREHVVLAPGGGWAAQQGSIEALPAGTIVVWLRVSPAEALRRLAQSGVERPLLAGPDPAGNLAALAEQRTERYQQAHVAVDVDGRSAADISEEIVEWLQPSIS